jgi:hypothetical protein
VELLEFVAERGALGLDRALVHEELLRLDAIKSELLSTAAHELHTPAAVIYGVAETLAGRGDELDPQDVRGLVDAFYDASVRLAQLMEDLLDFSRLEGGASAVSFAPVLLRKTIEEVTSGLTSEPIHEIEVEVPEELVLLSDRSARAHHGKPAQERACPRGGPRLGSAGDRRRHGADLGRRPRAGHPGSVPRPALRPIRAQARLHNSSGRATSSTRRGRSMQCNDWPLDLFANR